MKSKGDRAKRMAPKDKAWREAVFERDGHKCVRCGDPNVDAHHIRSKNAFPELRHNVSNGISLCRVHHRWAHDNPEASRDWCYRMVAALTHP